MTFKQKGQGLLEIMITVAIIAIAFIALTRFQTQLAYANSITQQTNRALGLALKQIETLRDYTTLTGASGSYQSIASGGSSLTSNNATYTTTWTVTAATNPTYKTIDVRVSWVDRNGTTQSVRLVTRVASLDPAYSSAIMG